MDNPVAWMVTYGELTNIVYTQPTQVVDTHYQPLYAAPPQRKWVGLTDEEITQCSYDAKGFMIDREVAMRTVAAKLKEKNT